MRMQPLQREIYMRGQFHGARGIEPKPSHYSDADRLIYENGYRKGCRLRSLTAGRKRHGNQGQPRPRTGGSI